MKKLVDIKKIDKMLELLFKKTNINGISGSTVRSWKKRFYNEKSGKTPVLSLSKKIEILNNNKNLLKISSKNYGEDSIGLSSEEINKLL